MLKHWNELAIGALVRYEGLGKAPENWSNMYWGIYLGNGLVYELGVGNVTLTPRNMHSNPSATLVIHGLDHEWHEHSGIVNLSDTGRVFAYNINGINEMVGLMEMGKIMESVNHGHKDPAWVILDYRPKQEYTVDELSKLVGRKVKIVAKK